MIIDCFSYKIYKSNLNFNYKNELVDIVSNISKEKLNQGNLDITNSSLFYYLTRNNDKYIKNNINIVDNLHSLIEDESNVFSNLFKLNKIFEIEEMWVTSYKNEEKCKPHHHCPESYDYTGIYYLNFDSDEHQSTTFYNNSSLTESVNPECEEDNLFIFPTYAMHGYSGVVSSKNRILIPFILKPKAYNKYY